MNKTCLMLVIPIIVFGLAGCSSNKNESNTKQVETIQSLERENKELSRLLENQTETLASSSNSANINESQSNDYEAFAQAFLKAEFEYQTAQERLDNLKPLTTGKMFQNLSTGVDTGTQQIKFSSRLGSVSIYQIVNNDDKITIIGKIEVSTQVMDNPKNTYSSLIELNLVKDSNSKYLVDSQQINQLSN